MIAAKTAGRGHELSSSGRDLVAHASVGAQGRQVQVLLEPANAVLQFADKQPVPTTEE
jgi:hypothetical protein